LLCVVAAVTAVIVPLVAGIGSASTVDTRSAPRAATTVPHASSYPVSCRRSDGQLRACAVVAGFFAALDRGSWGRACSMLGRQLRARTGGAACASQLALGAPEREPTIVGATRSGSHVDVTLLVPLRELDHFRTLRWKAFVGPENGRLRILETVRVASPAGKGATRARATTAPPSASAFRRLFVDITNRYAAEHRDPKRVGHAHCVEAAAGRYMCSYVVSRPGVADECHLMQARWTPQSASSFAVTLAGRALRCRSVRDAVRSLG
jgi:hypothetical protein